MISNSVIYTYSDYGIRKEFASEISDYYSDVVTFDTETKKFKPTKVKKVEQNFSYMEGSAFYLCFQRKMERNFPSEKDVPVILRVLVTRDYKVCVKNKEENYEFISVNALRVGMSFSTYEPDHVYPSGKDGEKNINGYIYDMVFLGPQRLTGVEYQSVVWSIDPEHGRFKETLIEPEEKGSSFIANGLLLKNKEY